MWFYLPGSPACLMQCWKAGWSLGTRLICTHRHTHTGCCTNQSSMCKQVTSLLFPSLWLGLYSTVVHHLKPSSQVRAIKISTHLWPAIRKPTTRSRIWFCRTGFYTRQNFTVYAKTNHLMSKRTWYDSTYDYARTRNYYAVSYTHLTLPTIYSV